jgi:UDP-N-acetylmuramate--alanine ligase
VAGGKYQGATEKSRQKDEKGFRRKVARMKKIHFMGIGGSGISGVAVMAKRLGYKVTGCDVEKETSYLKQVRKEGIKVFHGHDKDHLKGVDLLVTVPSVFFAEKKHPELKEGEEKGIAMTWQEFVGKELQKGKRAICVAGTHGKSTTTAMASLVLEAAKKDPTCLIGALVKKWGKSVRVGKGNLFLVEADEFFNNFLNYSPDTIILNNIEYDHPDYFETEDAVFESFEKHVRSLKGSKTLIVNQDSRGIKKLLGMFVKDYLDSLNIMGYTLGSPLFQVKDSLEGQIVRKSKQKTVFKALSKPFGIEENFELSLPGRHNVSNALGVILLGKALKIDMNVVRDVFSAFKGIGRRMEVIGKKKGIVVYDDYAHHPTAIKETLSGLRQKYPKRRIWVIVEPHSFSRTKALLSNYKGVFQEADKVILGPIFKARDKETFGVSGKSVVEAARHKDAKYFDSPDKIAGFIKDKAKPGDIIIVMGAGKSYQWSRKILNTL